MTKETSWLDTLFAACLSCSWLGVWPPTEWMVDNRCDTAIPEPRQNEDCIMMEGHLDQHS